MADGSIDDALDQLYAVAPADFTALRTRLAAAAKKRGDTAGAKQISAARKPTLSASVVNRLVHAPQAAVVRIADVGERLRAAHAAMDGDRIRELSAEQRKLVGELTRAALKAADVSDPSAALRDDVTGTLQAAIADPDVATRLGRLAKSEQWSGFGEFGAATAVASRKAPAAKAKKAEPPAKDTANEKKRAESERREQARAVLAAAEKEKADADEVTAQRQSDLATARLKHDDARARLEKAEQALAEAETAFEDAKRVGREAAEVVKAARRR